MVWFVRRPSSSRLFSHVPQRLSGPCYLPLGHLGSHSLMGVAASLRRPATSGCWLAGSRATSRQRPTAAPLTSFKDAMELAFQGRGGVSGDVHRRPWIARRDDHRSWSSAEKNAMRVLVGFGFGGSLAALFMMRVGGGIYTQGGLDGRAATWSAKIEPGPARRRFRAIPLLLLTTLATTSATGAGHGCRRVRVVTR